jgi:hypothetical protein
MAEVDGYHLLLLLLLPGLYWGKASSNNKKGHMIGHIKVRVRQIF